MEQSMEGGAALNRRRDHPPRFHWENQRKAPVGLRFRCVCLREPGYGRLREPLFQSVRYKTSSSAENEEGSDEMERWLATEE